MLTDIEQYMFDFLKINFLKALSLNENKMENKTKFNQRAFTAVGMFVSGIGLPLSGYMNHILGFESLTAPRHLWMSIHNILAVFFVVFSVWHIILNWKALKNHLKKSLQVFMSREAVYAASLVIIFLVLAALHAIAVSGRG